MRAGVSKLSKSPEVSTAIIPREKLTWPSRTTNEERFTSERNSSVPVFAFERVRFTFSSCELLRDARFGIVASVSAIGNEVEVNLHNFWITVFWASLALTRIW